MMTRTFMTWAIFIIVVGLCVLLWRYDKRGQAQTERDVDELAKAQLQWAAKRRDLVLQLSAKEPQERAKSNVVPETKKVTPNVLPRDVLRTNSVVQSAYLAAKRAAVVAAYGPLARQLNLSPALTKAFTDLIVQREETVFDAAGAVPRVFNDMTSFDDTDEARLVINPYDAATFSAGRLPHLSVTSNADTKGAVALLSEGIEEFNASVSELLGKDGFDALQSFERTLPVQPLARELAGKIAGAGQPLETSQSDSMTRMIAESTPTYQRGRDAIPGAIDWDQATARLAAVLTPAQMDAIKFDLEYMRENMHYNRELTRFSRR